MAMYHGKGGGWYRAGECPELLPWPVQSSRNEDTKVTIREAVKAKLLAIIEWTMHDGSLKSDDHRHAKGLAEEALFMLEPPLDRARDERL